MRPVGLRRHHHIQMRSATPDVLAIPLLYRVSAVWGISGVNTPKKMGFRTVAIGFGPDKENILAPKLGAHIYIDAKARMREQHCKAGRCRRHLGDRPQRSAIAGLLPASPFAAARCGWRLRRSNSGQRSSADFLVAALFHRKA